MSDPLQELIDDIHTEIERQLAHIKKIDPEGDNQRTQGAAYAFKTIRRMIRGRFVGRNAIRKPRPPQ